MTDQLKDGYDVVVAGGGAAAGAVAAAAINADLVAEDTRRGTAG